MKMLDKRRVVITGAANGIGAETAKCFATEGANLLLADRNAAALAVTAAECRALGARVFECVSDVGTREGAQKPVDLCLEHLGGIDILVNNAGLLTQGSCVDLSQELWDEMIAVDLTSVFVATQRALPFMLEQQWGRIINISSQLAIKGGAQMCHYAAAKAGVIGFTKSLALEVSKQNVLVNAVAPGPIDTALTAGVSLEWKTEKSKELPLGRFGAVAEVIPTILLLASEPGGNLYVGQTLGPNSGDVMQ
jgi:3-oxoacyl-[acyl-carrier protein] reductase